ncbi:MAG: FKBP-type peptidyl-prolyl cis-trans isomerase [Actinomycetota bacterium]|nr:FKBP-type peptidyl-prolyl cis-trans isomerase [Actinomycetota bacterium]
MRLHSRLLAAAFVLTVACLSACSSHAASSPSSGSPSGAAGSVTGAGVTVQGAFGSKPTVNIADRAAPSTLSQQVLTAGTGAAVAKGDTLVANYVGQTWAPKSGKPNVFDSSFDRGMPAAFVIGVGSVIPGWDKTLVGQKIGTRLLLSIPPADGYGTTGQSQANISGTDTLVFVIDVIATYKPNASAPGTPVTALPTTGFPKISNPAGKAPSILSTKGVKVPKKPVATLLVTGSGAKIDPAKTLVLQIVQADLTTGKNAQSSWGKAPQVVAGKNVLSIATVLTGKNIGSRALVLVPAIAATPATASAAAQPATPPQVLIADVVGQF